MIHDGYTRFAEISQGDVSIRIAYRPMLLHERCELANQLAYLNNESHAVEVYAQEVQKRVLNFRDLPAGLPESIHDCLVDAVMGRNPKSTEKEDAANLEKGVRLLVQYPHFQSFTCSDCVKWQLDPETGEISKRGGQNVERMPEDQLLCETPRGCPRGTHQAPHDLSAKNKKALRHYLECRAVGQFPDDGIVRQNARIIANELKDARGISFAV